MFFLVGSGHFFSIFMIVGRLIKDRYIPLKTKPMGDNHRTVCMLTAGQGLIYAAAFGVSGKTARLRPLIQPFSLCNGDLYLDPVKKLWRLKDGTCLNRHDSFHSSLKKYYAAVFWSELIFKTHGGAGSGDFFQLSADFLDELDRTGNEMVPLLLISVLWIFLGQEGIRPDLESCARCSRKAPEKRAVCYDPEGHVVCSRCRIAHLPVLTENARSFLLGAMEDLQNQDDIESLYSYILSILKVLSNFSFERESLDIILK